MSDTLRDYMLWIFAVAIGTWQLVEEIRRKESKLKIYILFMGIAIITWLGLDQIDRGKRDKNKTEKEFESITNQLTTIQQAKSRDSLQSISDRITDSIRDSEFQDRLFKEFKITRDSITNRPVQKNITTNIRKARDVYIQ